MSVKLISKYLYVYLLLYSGWNLVESAGPFQRRPGGVLPVNLLTVDLNYKKSNDTIIYTRDDRNDVEQFEAKDTYLFRKVLNDGQLVWEATGNNYAKKLLVRKDEKGEPKLTLYYHQPIPGPAAYKTNQRTDNASQRFQPGSLDAYPYGPFPQYVYDPYGSYVGYTGYTGYPGHPGHPGHPGYPAYGAPVPGGSGEMTRPPVIKTSTPVVVMPRRGSRGFKVSDYKRDNEGSEGERSPTEDERSKRKGHPRDKTVADDDDIEVVEELVSSDETPKKDGEQGEEGKADKKAAVTVVTGQDTRGAAAPAEPREDKREPQGAAANLGAGKVDNVVLKDLMDLVKALKNDVDLIKETLKNSDFDTSKLTGTATQKQPAVPALVKEFNATGDSSTIKMYAFGPDGEGAVGIDGSQYGHKLVLTVGDHSNVYILDGNSNTMSVTTAKDLDDDEDEEEGGEGPAVQDVYVNKSVPGAVGTVKGTVPPHSNLFIGGKGVPTPVVVPGLQHTPVQVVKAKPGDSSEDSPSEPSPSGTPAAPAATPGAVPAAAPAPSPVVLAAPATPATPATPAGQPAAPAATPVVLAAPATPATPATPAGQAAPATPPPTPATTPPATPAPGKKKLMDDDLKVTQIYGKKNSSESTEEENSSPPKKTTIAGSGASADAGATPATPGLPGSPLPGAPLVPPPGGALPIPPPGGMPLPTPAGPGEAAPLPVPLDPSQLPPVAGAAPIIGPPPAVPGIPLGTPLAGPLPPPGAPIAGLPLGTPVAGLPLGTPIAGAPIAGLPLGAPIAGAPLPAGPLPAGTVPPPPGTLGAPIAGPLPAPPVPVPGAPAGTTLPPPDNPGAPGAGFLSSEAPAAPPPVLPGGPTPPA